MRGQDKASKLLQEEFTRDNPLVDIGDIDSIVKSQQSTGNIGSWLIETH